MLPSSEKKLFLVYSSVLSPSAGSPMTLRVDGGESQAMLPNLTPGVTYQVTVFAVKGLEESEPGSDRVTTGTSHSNIIIS